MEIQNKVIVGRIIKIIAKGNPTFKEARSTMYAVREAVDLQRRYVGLKPVVSDSNKVNEIFSLFIEAPTTDSEASSIIKETFDELETMSSQSRLSCL